MIKISSTGDIKHINPPFGFPSIEKPSGFKFWYDTRSRSIAIIYDEYDGALSIYIQNKSLIEAAIKWLISNNLKVFYES